jgi:hypothetical protein
MLLPRDTVPTEPRTWRRMLGVGGFLLLVSILASYVMMIVLADNPELDWPLEAPVGFLITIAILTTPQILLLAGAPALPRIRPQRRRSMLVSLAGGAFVAGGLTFGIIASILNLTERWEAFGESIDDSLDGFAWIVLLVPWAIWFCIFAFAWSGQWIAIFRRMYKLLIAGTVLELLVTVPIDAKVRKQTDCYCGEGTFWALAIGIAAAFCTFGPGMVMLYFARYGQRLRRSPTCLTCGYDLRGLSDNRCPECGTAFDPKQVIVMPLNQA